MSNMVPYTPPLPPAAASAGTTAAAGSGGFFAAARRLLGAGIRAFSNLHPAVKVLVVAGTAVGATRLLGGSKHEAAQRVQ